MTRVLQRLIPNLTIGVILCVAATTAALAQAPTSPDERQVFADLQQALRESPVRHSDPALRRANIIARVACNRLALSGACEVLAIERQPIVPGIVLVSYRIQIGTDAEDVIVVHRGVPTSPPGRRPGLILLKGIGFPWVEAYLPGTFNDNVPRNYSPVITLVRDGVDVWGMDFRWDQIPADTVDLDFMADWGLATVVGDTRFLARFARYTRLLEGSGFSRLALGGWSAGVPLVYGVASIESQRPSAERDIRGLLPIDDVIKVDPTDAGYTEFACSSLPFYEELLADGIFALDNGEFIEIGELARDDPDGQSPFDPNLTNLQFLAALLATPFSEAVPFHNYGGSFDDDGVPTLLYVDVDAVPPFAATLSPYAPVLYFRDWLEIQCNDGVIGEFDRLNDIDLPILAVGAAGGTNEAGLYGANLTAGPVEFLKVGVLPPGEEAMDWGHSDLFLAPEATELLFSPILEWIESLR